MKNWRKVVQVKWHCGVYTKESSVVIIQLKVVTGVAAVKQKTDSA